MTSARPSDSRSRRNRLLIAGFGVLALIGVLLPGVFNYLLGGDRRVLVVTMQQGVANADRDRVRSECGGLPGISVVEDRGAADKQFRLTVRFRISDTTQQQEAALSGCLDRFPDLVQGVRSERDRD